MSHTLLHTPEGVRDIYAVKDEYHRQLPGVFPQYFLLPVIGSYEYHRQPRSRLFGILEIILQNERRAMGTNVEFHVVIGEFRVYAVNQKFAEPARSVGQDEINATGLIMLNAKLLRGHKYLLTGKGIDAVAMAYSFADGGFVCTRHIAYKLQLFHVIPPFVFIILTYRQTFVKANHRNFSTLSPLCDDHKNSHLYLFVLHITIKFLLWYN